MVLQARPVIITIIGLINSALLTGMIILTLSVGFRQVINRRFAILLFINLLANVLAIFTRSYAALGIQIPDTVFVILQKFFGVGIILGSYVGFLFTETLLGQQSWTARLRQVTGASAVILTVIILLPLGGVSIPTVNSLDNLSKASVLDLAVMAFAAVCAVGSIMLLRARRVHLPHPLFAAGLALFAVATIMMPVPGISGSGLTLFIGTIASILVSVAILRLQILNPLAQERTELAQERDQLLHVHDTVREMLDQTDLAARLRIAAKSLSSLGWRRVSIVLRERNLTITEPPGTTGLLGASAGEIWLRWWRSQPEAVLERRRIGIGYFFPREEHAASGIDESLRHLGDLLILPLLMKDGRPDALMILSGPYDEHQPTEERLRPLGIVAAQTRSLIENSKLLGELREVADELKDQVDELTMLQRVDQELSATLNFDSVMMLTMDWALRRTGATAGMLNMLSPDGTALIPVAALGYPGDFSSHYGVNNPLPLSRGILAQAVKTRKTQIVIDSQKQDTYQPLLASTRSEVAVPMEIRGRVLGVLNLESDIPDAFSPAHISFVQRLASRAVVAMDNARLYRETEGRADEMAALYSAGRSMSASLERDDVLRSTAQAFAAVLNVSSTVMASYSADKHMLTVTAVYRLGSFKQVTDVLLPLAGHVYHLDMLPEIEAALKDQRILAIRSADTDLTPGFRQFVTDLRCQAILVAPLTLASEVLGVAIVIDGRRSRAFTQDELLMVESVASQAASALRQAQLYEDVRELEKVKSDMIRMASHDLRNPLGNAIGYFEVLVKTIQGLDDSQREYIGYVRHSTNSMKTLIDDLLTLERIESERQSSWKDIDFTQLVTETVNGQQSAAELKQQSLTLRILPDANADYNVYGSTTQLRQAIANLVNNASKYTPDGGSIQVTLSSRENRLLFEVTDNGYGISKERQERLFQRFYRAQEPATDHIPGTGLGLSLVKTVIERHGGEVSVHSELGQGSTFAFTLPISPRHEESPAALSQGS